MDRAELSRSARAEPPRAAHSPEIFWRFLLLGCTSFGGPAAHLGYFRATFVERLGWLDDPTYGRLIALGQFLPGPGSSQVGFAIGLARGGLAGGLAAFLGFTLPSFLIMLTLALGTGAQAGTSWFEGTVAGLKLLAVVVVADATAALWRSFSTTLLAGTLSVATACALLVLPGVATQLAALLAAALAGLLWPGRMPATTISPDRGSASVGPLPALLFALLLLGLPLARALAPELELVADFYQAGALVFGGGHVVLPLLQESVGEALGAETFLTGYAAAQGVPGPLFTFATYLGAVLHEQPLLGAGLATAAIFLPGFLLVLALHRAWDAFAARPRVAASTAAINAAVVGLLLAALYRPVFVSAVTDGAQLAAAVAGYWWLTRCRPPILLLVLAFAIGGGVLGEIVGP